METFYYLEKALGALSPVEQKRFEKFLSSAYFHKRHFHNSHLHKFYKILKSEIIRATLKTHTKPDKLKSNFLSNELIFDKDNIIQKIYPDKRTGCKNQFIKLSSELLSYFLDFLSIESFKGSSFFYKISILNELNKRNLDDFFWHYCRVDRFDELNCKFEEPGQSYYIWKLVQALNIHKEKKINSISSRHLLEEGQIDYDTEKHLLKKYLKKELINLLSRQQARQQENSPETNIQLQLLSTKKPQVFRPTA